MAATAAVFSLSSSHRMRKLAIDGMKMRISAIARQATINNSSLADNERPSGRAANPASRVASACFVLNAIVSRQFHVSVPVDGNRIAFIESLTVAPGHTLASTPGILHGRSDLI
jgi:hypothetical protein